MTSEQPARAPEKKILTPARLTSAVLVFSLLAVALSSSCNPTDGSRDGSKAAPPTPADSAGATPRLPNQQQQPPPAQQSPTPLADELMNATLTTLDGKTLTLSSLKGKVVVLNLWATWCGPCRREIPDFIELQKDYQGRDIEVLGITSEDERNTAESVKEFVKEFEINYKVVWADAKAWEAFLAPRYSIPQTYVIGPDGNLIRKFVGYSPQVATMVREIADEALGNTTAGSR
ncbi:MAG TPA: TlpA disulfide reductase family protein [Pyrinomonadaceae bacterium]|jgi:cytochrome c biogenesis protein CcmG/thiol:disulfide interchange protein DsbE